MVLGASFSVIRNDADLNTAKIGCRSTYLLHVSPEKAARERFHVVLHESATPLDILHAYVHAYYMGILLVSRAFVYARM